MRLKNPLTAIWRSDAPWGLKIIAYSLLLVFATALPYILYVLVGPAGSNPVGLGVLFAGGAMVAHVGFVVGLVMLMWKHYWRK